MRGTVGPAVGQRPRGFGVRLVRHTGLEEFAVFQTALGRRAFAAVFTQRLLSADGRIRQQAGPNRSAR